MKKRLMIVVSVIAMTSLTSCSTETTSPNKDKTIKENIIYDLELSKDEEEILDLVGIDDDIDIYEFNVDDEFKQLNIWLEVYKDGELLSRADQFSTPIEAGKNRIAVRVEGEQQEMWTIKHKGKGSTTGVSFELDEELKNDIDSISTSGKLDNAVEITTDKEIVLKKYLFDDSGTINSFDNQYYADNPSVIKDYPYVYLLKCKVISDER